MLALVFSAALTVTAPAQLATNLPLQQQDKTVAQIDCILQQLAQPFELVSLPWLRARQEVTALSGELVLD
jgi:hypothetical protein